MALRDPTNLHKKSGQLVTHYGSKRFERPTGVSVGPNDVVAVDAINKEGVVLNKYLTLICTIGQGNGDNKLNNPIGVAVGHNVIAVSEDKEYVVKKFSLEGDYLGSAGTADGQFNNPQGLCYSSKGLLFFVADRDNHRVQVFDQQHKFFNKLGNEEDPGSLHTYWFGVFSHHFYQSYYRYVNNKILHFG